MVDATISCARMRELACPGRSRARHRRLAAPLPVACASRRQGIADASSIANALPPRPRAASSRPEGDDLLASTICPPSRVRTMEARMVFLGFGKYARADRIYALQPITGDQRGTGQ